MIWLWFYLGLGFGIWAIVIFFVKRSLTWHDLFTGVAFTFLWPLILMGVIGWTANDYIKKKPVIWEAKNEDKRADREN